MYQFINKHIAKILRTVDRRRDIAPYMKLVEIFDTGMPEKGTPLSNLITS